jgi:hypothetical protein
MGERDLRAGLLGRLRVAAIVVTLAGPALAVDGVREINQASVVGAVGALHVISAPGSYRLTGDLLAPTGASGIRIEANDVSLDLNGFTISGGGFGLAIHGVTASGFSNVEVRNGTIRNFPTSGVHLPSGLLHRVIDVRVIGNGNFGINIQGTSATGGHLVRGCTALQNGSGMRIESPGSLLLDSVARDNTNIGLVLGAGVGFARNASSNNGTTDVSGGIAIECNLIGGSAVCPP